MAGSILGVDVGGTFTDFLLWERGRLRVYKRPSTPDDPARAVLLGLAEMGAAPREVLRPLDPAELEWALDSVCTSGVESLAICFLFSFLHPEHVQAAATAARA